MTIQRIPQQIPQETGPQETGPQESISETESVNADDDDDADDDTDDDADELDDSDDSCNLLVDIVMKKKFLQLIMIIVQIHKLLHDYLILELKIQLSIQTMKVILMKLEEVLIILMLVLVVISLIL